MLRNDGCRKNAVIEKVRSTSGAASTAINVNKIAIIGTAGRDRNPLLNIKLWEKMKADLRSKLSPSDTVVSGGAAWADHLAVHAYLANWCRHLELKLPAPFENDRFLGNFKSAGSTATYYHSAFSIAIGENSITQISQAIEKGASYECEPGLVGISGMFARNAKIAKSCTSMIAYTFGDGNIPAAGGTKDTWNKVAHYDRVHVDLKNL
jgi:hypothetical protein